MENVSLYHYEVTFFILGNIFYLKFTQFDINIAIHLFLFVLSWYILSIVLLSAFVVKVFAISSVQSLSRVGLFETP